MKIKSALILSASFLTVLLYQNCSKPVSQSSYVVSGLTAQDISNEKALTILTAKCSSCHSADMPSGGIDVLSIDQLLATGAVVPTEPNLSPLFLAISAGTMPPTAPLPQEDIAAISDWIATMSKDQPVSLPPGAQPLPLGPTYASIYQNILTTKCLGCHSSANSKGGVSFSSYNSTSNTVQKTLPMSSSLYTSVAVRNTMPANAPGSLSAAEKQAIFDWITAGGANN